MYLRKLGDAILNNVVELCFLLLATAIIYVGLSTPRIPSPPVPGVPISPVVTTYLELLDQLPAAERIVVTGLIVSNPVRVDDLGRRGYLRQRIDPTYELVIQVQNPGNEICRQYGLQFWPDSVQYESVRRLTLGAEIKLEVLSLARPHLDGLKQDREQGRVKANEVQWVDPGQIVRIEPVSSGRR